MEGKEEKIVKEKTTERNIKVPTKSMVRREMKEAMVEEVKEEVRVVEEEMLVESFKKLKLNTSTTYILLKQHEGEDI